MFYQLPNGRVIELSTEQYLEMSDEELEYLIAFNYGEVQENPWHGSILTKHDRTIDDFPEIMPELTDVPEIDKFLDLDVDSKLEEE
jgi:hypothetical protein